MECETFCEARPVARSARSVPLHVSTHRSERWRIEGCVALQAMLFRPRSAHGHAFASRAQQRRDAKRHLERLTAVESRVARSLVGALEIILAHFE
jgi:hypothetical protein